MSQTVIPWGDPKAQKKWGAGLAVQVAHSSYWARKFIGTSENSVIQRKTELEGSPGDRVSFDLSMHLRGGVTRGDDRLKGKEEDLKFFTDEVALDQMRKSVSAGGRMTRKRVVHDLRKVARDRLRDYWAQYMDEFYFMYLSGARGVNQDFIESPDFTGHAGMALQAPDSDHLLYGGSATSLGSITSSDLMSTDLIERAVVRARMMRALDPKTSNMQPVNIGGQKHYVAVMSVFQSHDLRTASSSKWLDFQKALATADGRANKIFQGGLGMVNNVILHDHESIIRFENGGSGTNLPVSRALFLGRQAGVIAHGTTGGLSFTWKEEVDDFGNEPVVAAGTILGMKKTRFNGKDFGVMSLDTYAKNPNASA